MPVLIGLGFVHVFCLMFIWGFLSVSNPLADLLLQCCAAAWYFQPLIFVHDLLINVLLSVPIAALIAYLQPQIT